MRTLSEKEAAAVMQGEIDAVTRRYENALDMIPAGNQSANDLLQIIKAYEALRDLTTGDLQLEKLEQRLNLLPLAYLTTMMYVRVARGEQELPVEINANFLNALQTLGKVLEKKILMGRFIAVLRSMLRDRMK